MNFQELAQAWKECTPAQGSAFETLEPGNYVARIDAVKKVEAKETASIDLPPGVAYELSVTEGKYKGARVLKEDRLWSAQSLRFLKRDILTLECTIPANLSDVVASLASSIGRTVEIKVTTTKSGEKIYQNIYFNRLCERLTPEPSDVFGAEIFDDAPPF